MNPYFNKTEHDELYYEKYLKNRMPMSVLDMHSHMNLPEHLVDIPKERIDSDWALQAGHAMTCEEARFYAKELFPEKVYKFVGFPFPIAEADLKANNNYIAECIREGKIEYGLMVSRPEWSVEYIEEQLKNKNFAGLKPYPDLVSKRKGAQVSIFDFITKDQLAVAQRLNKCVLLHIPRSGRLADLDNVRELKEIVKEFPKLKVIIAHLGRCFNPKYFKVALELFGEDIHKFWFDTAAVMNSKVHELAFANLAKDRVMFGLDLPIFLWHGRRYWTEDTYINVCKENLPWKKEIDDEVIQNQYTYFVYEQINNLLNTMEKLNWDKDEIYGFFELNAIKFFTECTIKEGE